MLKKKKIMKEVLVVVLVELVESEEVEQYPIAEKNQKQM